MRWDLPPTYQQMEPRQTERPQAILPPSGISGPHKTLPLLAKMLHSKGFFITFFRYEMRRVRWPLTIHALVIKLNSALSSEIP